MDLVKLLVLAVLIDSLGLTRRHVLSLRIADFDGSIGLVEIEGEV